MLQHWKACTNIYKITWTLFLNHFIFGKSYISKVFEHHMFQLEKGIPKEYVLWELIYTFDMLFRPLWHDKEGNNASYKDSICVNPWWMMMSPYLN
jgi:hypothetical protein